jgi:hypothetical protein
MKFVKNESVLSKWTGKKPIYFCSNTASFVRGTILEEASFEALSLPAFATKSLERRRV